MSIEFIYENRLKWFQEARYGMFIHWGLYSILGRTEWAMNREQIPWNEYEELLNKFTIEDFDPRKWAAIAKRNGMKYVVLTTKHHEGFCLWDSKLCDFNSVNSPAQRDCVKEFVEAVREAGLKVGLYYSLGDWRNPDWEAGYLGDAEAKKRFMRWTHGLIDELVSNYGKIDIFWYDLPQNYSAAEWGSVDLNHKIRLKQPHILINNRAFTSEDFGTPEGVIKAAGAGRMWEACMTLNGSWGYIPDESGYLSAKEVISMLFKSASGCGNLLLNVGPTGSGLIPCKSEEILDEVGRWLEIHGEAIYGSTPHGMGWGIWGGACSAKDNVLYIPFERFWFPEYLSLGYFLPKVLKATFLSTGEELEVIQEDNRTIIKGLPKNPPENCPIPVIKLECDSFPAQDFATRYKGMDIFPEFP